MQLKLMESGFDWDKEIRTSDPEYFKWTQYYGCLIQVFIECPIKVFIYQSNLGMFSKSRCGRQDLFKERED